jgi:hypothetical protein
MIAEEISYDALDTSVNESRGSKRKSVDDSELSCKRRSVNSTTLSAASGRSIGSAKSGKSSKSSAKTTTKYHYPKVLSQPSQQLLSATREGDHATVLRLLVEELVEQEKSALNAHFQSAEISNMKGRRHIFGSLDKLLTDLPEIVQQASHSSLQFEAEGSTGGSSELATLIEVKNVLLQHSAKLERYEQDLTALAEDQDLWIGRERIVETIRAVIRVSLVDTNPCSLCINAPYLQEPSAPSAEEETGARYQELLRETEQHCTTILGVERPAREVMQRAREVQDSLYNSANSVSTTCYWAACAT